MEWLKNIALPQSSEHIELLGYMFIIIMFLFTMFSGILFWGTVLSVYLKRKESKNLDVRYRRLSKEILDVVLFNKISGIIFSILPLITVIIIFAQLFQSQNNQNLVYLTYSVVFLLISLLLVYSYKNSLTEFRQVDINSGLFSIILLFFSLWLFNTALASSIFPGSNTINTSVNLFSSTVLIGFLLFLLISLAMTGAVILFLAFNLKNTDPDADEEYINLVKNISLKSTFTAVVLIPLLAFIVLIMLPQTSLSGTFFFYLILGIVFLFVIYHLLYYLSKKINKTIAAYLFVVLIFFLLTIVISSQLLVANSNKVHFAMLSSNYEKYLSELKGVDKAPVVSGEEVYKISCSVCHDFEKRVVGPPHNEVVPKYFGKEEQLISFIRNPMKVNPDYPPMPNPGLKPDQAKAVADYLLEKVKENLSK